MKNNFSFEYLMILIVLPKHLFFVYLNNNPCLSKMHCPYELSNNFQTKNNLYNISKNVDFLFAKNNSNIRIVSFGISKSLFKYNNLIIKFKILIKCSNRNNNSKILIYNIIMKDYKNRTIIALKGNSSNEAIYNFKNKILKDLIEKKIRLYNRILIKIAMIYKYIKFIFLLLIFIVCYIFKHPLNLDEKKERNEFQFRIIYKIITIISILDNYSMILLLFPCHILIILKLMESSTKM